MKKISKKQLLEYFILVARIWLAFILLAYSVAKLTGYQFYTSPELLKQEVKDANLFLLSWFLADHEPFKIFIAVSQIIAACLLIFNRTCIIGAFMVVPIWLNILIWDLSFMDGIMRTIFFYRITYYLILTIMILWFYKDKIFIAIRNLTEGIANQPKNKRALVYLSLPLVGYSVEFIVGKLVNLSGYVYYFFSKL